MLYGLMFTLVLMLEFVDADVDVDAESIFGSLLLSHGSYCRFVFCLCKSVFFVLYSKSLVLGFSCQEISNTSPNDRCVHV